MADGLPSGEDVGDSLRLPRKFLPPLMTEEEVGKASVDGREAGAGERARAVLEEEGWCVVTHVADEATLRSLEEKWSKDLVSALDLEALESGDAVMRGVGEAVVERGCVMWPRGTRLGPQVFVSDRGLSQGSFSWGCRLLPRVQEVFAGLYGGKEVVVSLDLPFFTPPGLDETGASIEGVETGDACALWPHADQNLHVRGSGSWDVFQGVVYVWDASGKGATTTVVWPKSHGGAKGRVGEGESGYARLMRGGGVEEAGRSGGVHYVEIGMMAPGEDRSGLMRDFVTHARRVPVRAGSLLLWDSRLLHQGYSGGARLAQPVCWEPRERRGEEARRRKLRLAALGLPSTHWASLGMQHDFTPPILLPSRPKPNPHPDKVTLPLKPSIVPTPLTPSADHHALCAEFLHSGITPDEEHAATLEEALEHKVVDVL